MCQDTYKVYEIFMILSKQNANFYKFKRQFCKLKLPIFRLVKSKPGSYELIFFVIINFIT